MIASEALSTVVASISVLPAREVHFWTKPATGQVLTGTQIHSDLVDLHWREMGLPEDHSHTMYDAIAHGWTRVRITADAAIIHTGSLRDARRVLTSLLDNSAVFELPITVSVEHINILWHKGLAKWVAVVDMPKTKSYQLHGFEDAERFARGVTRLPNALSA